MTRVDPAALAYVVGGVGEARSGLNIERVKGKHIDIERALTDYGYCVATVHSICKAAHGGFLWGTYGKAAAQCAFDELPKVCGQPATDPAAADPQSSGKG